MKDENQNIEYKESWRDEYLKWICGFANAQGGKIYIGVNDDCQVVGVQDSHKLMEDIPNKIVSQLGIVCEVNLLHEGELDYIEIVVEASNVPISYHGKYHYRSGATKQELNGLALQQFVLKKLGRSWDDITNEYATLDDLDRSAIEYFLERGIATGRIDAEERGASTESVLENLNLVGQDGHLKNAALLLFGKRPGKFFTCVEFKIGRFGQDEADLLVQDVVEGNIIQMPAQVMRVLKSMYLTSPIHYDGMQRVETLEIPEAALREIIYNAIAHKDYTGVSIQMHVYDDRVEIWNEGTLPEGYTPETLMGYHSSRPRNRNISNAFFKAGFIEAWGRGYKKIREAFEMAGMPIPTVEEVDGGIRVTILRKHEGSVTPQVSDQVSDQASDQASDQPTDQATDQARRLIKLVRQRRMSLKEMMAELNMSHRTFFKNKYLNPCLKLGWMDRVYPDKPSHPDQKYFLTELGKKQLSLPEDGKIS